jgi:hypothetical protein
MFKIRAVAVWHQAITKLKLGDNRGFFFTIRRKERCNTGPKIKNGYTLDVISGLSETVMKKFKK